jgi:MFS family permease
MKAIELELPAAPTRQPITEAEARSYRKVALAACFGTFIEWYDFLTFGTLAAYFAVLFFPAQDPVAALLYSLAAFGVGMVVRPIGAALFGSFGDRYGRRKTFIATIGIMGAATFAVGLLPTHAQWGWTATGMLLALRLIQGLAMGGEIGGANVYLAEHAPARRRGAATSVLQWMGGLGILASALQIMLLQNMLSDAAGQRQGASGPARISRVRTHAAKPLNSRHAFEGLPAGQANTGAHGLAVFQYLGRGKPAFLLLTGVRTDFSEDCSEDGSGCRGLGDPSGHSVPVSSDLRMRRAV